MITYYRVIKHGEVTFRRDATLLHRLPTLATHDQCIHFQTAAHASVCFFRQGRIWVRGPFAIKDGQVIDGEQPTQAAGVG